jgi:ribosomal-protein-alanine N-acetyltransferase
VITQPLLYTIRPMEPDDVPTVVAIDRLSFPTPWLASSYLYELNHNHRSCYYVLLKPTVDESKDPEHGWLRRLRDMLNPVAESLVIGYVGFRFQTNEAHISTIAVHPAWRGRGLGELLLLTAVEKALEMKMSKLSLEVRPSNTMAQHLYHKYGFRFTGVQRGYYRDGEDAWLMHAWIAPAAYQARLAELSRLVKARVHFQWVDVGQDVGQNDGDTI